MDKIDLNFDFPKHQPSSIKVIGVGGGGGNAVIHMHNEGIRDVEFVLCNTDDQALGGSNISTKVQLGKTVTKGLGAGNKPEVAREAAEESIDDIRSLLNDETNMVFITAGMGGGTGTGAAPTIAKIAKEMDILTVGIVTIPFLFEGEPKIIKALHGVEEMSKSVDALLVINNERLRDIYPDLTVFNAFKKADDTLAIAAKSIAEIITTPGIVNLDFADVNTTLKNGGVAIMSSGRSNGLSRVSKAIENALHSPLLNNNDIFRAKKILFNIYCSNVAPMDMHEMNEVNDFMAKFNRDIDVIWGIAEDDTLGEDVKITILATGFQLRDVSEYPENPNFTDIDIIKKQKEEEEERKKKELERELIKKHYGGKGDTIGKITRPKPFVFSADQMDNNDIVEAVINHPTYDRKQGEMEKIVEEIENR